MKKGADWISVSQCLNYWELCCIEDALNAYAPPDLTEYEKEALKDLRDLVETARGWRHHMGKTDRKEV